MKKKLKKILALTLVMVLGLGFAYGTMNETANILYWTNEPDVTVTQLSVEKHTKNEIAAMYKELNIAKRETAKNTYTVNPSIKNPYTTGTLSNTSINNGLAMINFYRYMAGVSYDLKIDSDRQNLAQAAALIQAVQRKTGVQSEGTGLEHTPEKPVGMDDLLYNQCFEGSEKSLLTAPVDNTAESINSLMSSVVHRNSLLDPQITTVGIGMVDDCGAVCWREDVGNLYHSADTAVAWPSYNTPVEFFKNYSQSPDWSVCLSKKNLDQENIKVTLTRKRDGKIWTFTKQSIKFNVDDIFGIISFNPSVTSFKIGDVYNVKIKGNTIDLDYDVNFFSITSPNRAGTAPAPTITTKDKTYSYSTLQKKSVSFQISAKAATPIAYSKGTSPDYFNIKTKVYKDGSKYFSVSSSGKVTIKKGAPKGTYKVVLQSTTGTKYYYKSAKKYVTIKVQ